MIITNEFVRFNTQEEGYKRQGVTAINSAKRMESKCSWICHNDTDFCKNNHVKIVKQHFETIDPMYFGIINALKSTGDYGLANIIFLVVLIPGIMYFLLIKSISMQMEIRKIKSE